MRYLQLAGLVGMLYDAASGFLIERDVLVPVPDPVPSVVRRWIAVGAIVEVEGPEGGQVDVVEEAIEPEVVEELLEPEDVPEAASTEALAELLAGPDEPEVVHKSSDEAPRMLPEPQETLPEGPTSEEPLEGFSEEPQSSLEEGQNSPQTETSGKPASTNDAEIPRERHTPEEPAGSASADGGQLQMHTPSAPEAHAASAETREELPAIPTYAELRELPYEEVRDLARAHGAGGKLRKKKALLYFLARKLEGK